MQFQDSLPSNNTSILKTHPNTMKSQQLISKSSNSIFSGRRVSKGFAAMFAAALAMGLGASSLIAQGPYYPQVNPLGGGAFDPNGKPVISSLDLNAIETKLVGLFPTKTLIIPSPTGKSAASVAEYAAAVKALATDVANGAGPVGVTFSTLAAEIASYRQAQAPDALGALAEGVIASGSGTKVAQLSAAAAAAAGANPTQIGSPDYQLFLNKIALDLVLSADLDTVVASILTGSVSTSLGASAVQPASLSTLLGNAVSAANLAPILVPARKTLIEDIAGAAVTALLASPQLNKAANLDFATQALTIPSGTVDLEDMVAKIRTTIGAVTFEQAGAIAQGALRNAVNRNLVGYTDIKAGLASNTYSNDLVDAFAGYTAPTLLVTTALVGAFDDAAVAAAGSLKWVASAGTIVKDVLTVGLPGPGTPAQIIVARAAAAAQTQASSVAIATTNAAGFGGATAADIVAGVITGAQIGNAGLVAKAVASNAANLNAVQAPLIAGAAISAAAAVSTATNKSDAYADIAYYVGVALKSGSALDDPRRTAAVTAMVQQIALAGAGKPTYIAVVGALAGNGALNAAAIKTAGLAADGTYNAGANSVPVTGPIDAGANLVAALLPLSLNELGAYAATTSALSTAGTVDRDRALLYAATLAHPSDVVGALAAVITKSALAPASTLTQDAISASRTKQANLAVAGDVAKFIRTNGLLTDIQAYIGEKVVANPSFVADIATAGTVSIPTFSHYVAHAIAFNAPKQAYLAATGILQHSLITATAGVAGVDRLTMGDRPAAVAAISAALATGIIESRDLSVADRRIALRDAVKFTVTGLGPTHSVYNAQPGSPAADLSFQRSDGNVGTFTTGPAKGVAGAVTGFVAQLAKPGAVSLVDQNFIDITTALSAIAAAVGSGGFNIDIAQAAAQAIGWVSGQVAPAGVAAAIANAVFAGYGPGATLVQLTNAATFGLTQANGGAGAPGAGAAGLRQTTLDPYYSHSSASGNPVSNILSL